MIIPKTYFKKISQYQDQILIIAQLIPYLFYIYLIEIKLDKSVAADSFRYLWENGSTFAYFTNSSLTIRLIYTFAENNLNLICQIQLALVAIAQLSIYRYLKNDKPFNNIAISAILIIFSLSHHSRWLVDYAMSDSLFISLFFIFLSTYFCSSKNDSSIRKFTTILITTIFIFSRNLGPYIVLLTIPLITILNFRYQKYSPLVIVASILISISAISITNKFDTSTELNAANNITIRILPDENKTKLFHELYGMPIGPFVKTCAGGSINSMCFNYQRIQTGSTYTRTYKVTVDDFHFADWIREKGMKSWQNYIFFQDTRNTFETFTKAYKWKFYLMFQTAPSEFWGKQYTIIPDRIDPFVTLYNLYSSLHLNNLLSLLVVITFSFVIYCTSGLKREFLFTTVLLIDGLGLFFIGFFGDASSQRQVYPGILTIYIAQFLFIFFLTKLLFCKLKYYFLKKQLA